MHIVGKVIDIDPPGRLVVSWARPADEGNEAGTSRVTYEVEPLADSVKLTVTQDEFGTDTEMLESVSFGWPVVLSGLKTLLETRKPLPTEPRAGCK